MKSFFNNEIILERRKVNLFLLLLISAGYLYFFYQLFIESTLKISLWTISDWLINYQDGGFKRRGLSGSILFIIQDFTGISLTRLVLLVQIISYLVMLCLLYYNLKKKKLDLYFLGILLSPFVLFFPLCSVGNAGRKEILLFLLFYIYAFSQDKKLYDWVTLFFYLVVVFLHELAYFYLPFLLWLQYKKNKNQLDYSYLFSAVVFSTVAVLFIYFFGGNINQGNSIDILVKKGVYVGSSNIFTSEFAYDFNHVLQYKFSFCMHLLEFLLIIFQFTYYVYYFQKSFFKEYIYWSMICVIWLLPLFYLGIDWFRWIYIYANLLLLILFLQLPNDEKIKHVSYYQSIKIWQLLFTPLLFLFFYFHMNHDEIFRWITQTNF